MMLTSFGGCRKSTSPTDRLPPLTHQGLNTMGCMVDGKLFVPQAPAFYPYGIYGIIQQGYPGPNLTMGWTDKGSDCSLSGLQIILDSIQLQQGLTIDLAAPADSGGAVGDPGPTFSNQWATYTFADCDKNIPFTPYTTTGQVTGQVTITWYDAGKGVVAGTFWFNAIDKAGDTAHVTEGRFDMALQ